MEMRIALSRFLPNPSWCVFQRSATHSISSRLNRSGAQSGNSCSNNGSLKNEGIVRIPHPASLFTKLGHYRSARVQLQMARRHYNVLMSEDILTQPPPPADARLPYGTDPNQ